MTPGHAHYGSDPQPSQPDFDLTGHSADYAKHSRDLRIALLDGDEDTHLAVQKMFATHAQGWRLHSYRDTCLALRGIPAVQPHVVLMDLCVAGNSCLHCSGKLKAIISGLPILIYSKRSDEEGILQSILAGACGNLVKPDAHRDFFPAVIRAADGRLAFCDKAERVLANWFGLLAVSSQLGILTPREREFLPSILAGLEDKEISRPLKLATSTIHGYRTELYRKFGAHSCEQLIKKFHELGQPPFR